MFGLSRRRGVACNLRWRRLMAIRRRALFAIIWFASLCGCAEQPDANAPASATDYDLLITQGVIYDGSGGTPFIGDVAIKGDRLIYVGQHAPGAAAARINELGEGDVQATPAQLVRMRAVVHRAMEEGAMGVSSALIYAPGSYARTPEIIALADEAAKCGGIYISHMRSEGNHLT